MKRHASTCSSNVLSKRLALDGARRRSVCACAALLALGACHSPAREIFPRRAQTLAWPPPPASARVRFVGSIRGAEDLKPPARPFEALGELLVGKAEPRRLYGPMDVVRTADRERLWVADPGGRCLHLFDLESRAYQKVQRCGKVSLLSPVGLCLGAGALFVCDSEDVAIHRLSEVDGRLLGSLRLPADILRPVALQYDARRDELFVVDVRAHDIKVLNGAGQLLRIIGQRGRAAGQFNYPCDIALHLDTLWVVDAGNQRVQALSRDGTPLLSIGQAGDAPGDLALPKAVAVDSEGNVYVVDARFENIQMFDSQGLLLLVFGQEGTGPGEFWLPAGLHIDYEDRIWLCDSYNSRIQVFDYLGASDHGDRQGP